MEQQDIHLAGTTLRDHRHVCAFFQSREERYRVLGPFVKEGLERGEKGYHVVDPARRVEHLHRLHAAGIDVRSALASGQLEVRGWDEVYLRGGRFDPDATLASYGKAMARAKDMGFPLTRVIGEMEWALRDPSCGFEKVVQYEAHADTVFAGSHDPRVCTYDRSQFGAAEAMDAFAVHRAGVTGGVLQENPLLGGPIAFHRGRASVELAALRKQFLMALVAGGRRDAIDIVVEEGLWLAVPVTSLYLDVVQPALNEMGRLCTADRVSVAHVMLAAEIAKLALAQLRLHLPCQPSNGMTTVVACVEGDTHDIGAYMVADFLEMAGFEVRFLGPSVPTRMLVSLIEEQPPGLLALSVTGEDHLEQVRRVVRGVRRAGKGCVKIAVGGQLLASRPELRRELGVDLAASTPEELVMLARGLLDRSRDESRE
jgi:methanogenic corrinoid protein MtbC1